jgi:hypothetical protein
MGIWVCIRMYAVHITTCAYHNMCIYIYEAHMWANSSAPITHVLTFFAYIILYLHVLYVSVLHVYACMLFISLLYVYILHVLAQTSTLTAITW